MSNTQTLTTKTSRKKAFTIITTAYTVAGISACMTGWFMGMENILLMLAVADLVATVVIFGFSVRYKNSSFYDAYWSVIPIWIVLFYMIAAEPGMVNGIRAGIGLVLVLLWGVRLTYNWARGWTGLDHEDWRYGMLKQQSGKLYPLVNFSAIHLFPTVMVFLGCIPLYPAMFSSANPLNLWDLLAVLVTLGGIFVEGTADNQLRKFRLSKPPQSAIMNQGLWAYARHPNYFGEMTFWVGIFILGYAADPSWAWSSIGAILMISMFVFATGPMIDKRMLERRPDYRAYMNETWGLIPWFPKKKK